MSYRNKVLGAGLGYALAGPAGAVFGLALAGSDGDDRGYDMSDIPFGVYVESAHEDDEVGRRWTLTFLSQVPSPSHAVIRLVTDSGQRLRGHAPFVDAGGEFVASAAIHSRHCTLYVPLGAVVYASPKNISLEVSVWVTQPGGGATPVGKAILDAALPPPRPWQVADYLSPMTSLCARVVMAANKAVDGELEGMVERLADALGFERAQRPDGMVEAMLASAHRPLSVEDAARVARFRLPGLTPAELMDLLWHASFPADGEADATPSQRLLLNRVVSLLS